MRYTVLGANGFIGSHLVQALKDDNVDVFTPGRDDPSIFSKNLGVVFYCIGMTADFRKNVSATVDAHVSVFSRLVENADFDQIIYCSSTRLYDNATVKVATADMELKIDSRNPRQLYDISKALGENICLTATRGRGSVARLSGVFDWKAGSPGFLSELLLRAETEKSFSLDSAPNYTRDYIHISDVVRALKKMADLQPQTTWNVASGETISNQKIVSVLNSHGWNIDFLRDAPEMTIPECDISPLITAGVRPAKTLDVISHWVERKQHP